MYKGKMYSVSLDYKPSKMEAQRIITAEIEKVPVENPRMTFSDAAKAYIEMKSNILSPSTTRSRSRLLTRIETLYSPEFSQTTLSKIDMVIIQTFLNQYAKNHSPKSVRDMYGFISVILKNYDALPSGHVSLPQKQINEPYVPTDEDVRRVWNALKGTDCEVPVMLAACGLRRSEICALDISDFDFENGTVRIGKAKLQDEKGNWIIAKRNKTVKSTRTVFLPQFILEKVKQKGYVYHGAATSLTKRLYDVEDSLGIKRFSIHKLRHYYASMAHAQGMPEAYILKQGGWSSPDVMKRVYRHAMEDEEKRMAEKAIKHMEEIRVSDN